MAKPASNGGGAATFSVIGADVTLTGDIHASADLHIDGAVQGDITCAALVQGETSRITGAIRAQSARLAGQLVGSIAVRELTVLRSARIEGDVQYEVLTIEQGAQIDGKLAHDDFDSSAPDLPHPGEGKAAPGDATGLSDEGGEPKLSLAR